MEKTRLLIADCDDNFTASICRHLSSAPDIEVLGCERDGLAALRKIRSVKPDAVLFDLVLPGLDGLTLLRSINEIPNAPATICCTRFFSEVSLEAVRTFGASYLLFKPIELQALRPCILACTEMHRKLRRMAQEMADMDGSGEHEAVQIRNYLVSLGIPAKLIGCSYLAEAVRLGRQDMSLVRNLSKGLYHEISRNMNTTPVRVERCIRRAVSAAHQSGALDGKLPECPSNKEFINYVLRTMNF